MSIEDDQRRYQEALHGVQTAIAYEQMMGMGSSHIDSHKHLRCGIDSAMVTDRAIANLLIDKGVFTREEYIGAVASAMELELAEREDRFPGVIFR